MKTEGKKIDIPLAQDILRDNYNTEGELSHLPGEIDFNFLVKAKGLPAYILKISEIDQDLSYTDFQVKILTFLSI
ncbi:MAG: hypothetical protein U5K51_10905 [Flavobacteriaceae bacterium]|nr:hypothetical protein [Flavobacteriaceae bacterium]